MKLSRILFLITMSSFTQISTGDDYQISDLSLEELLSLDVKVNSASLFEETPLTSSSVLTSISRERWEQWGAYDVREALIHEPSISSPGDVAGLTSLSVRGWMTTFVSVSSTIDGLPIDMIQFNSGLDIASGIGLSNLDNIELIRGPGASLYGTDAHQGVLTFNTYRKDKEFREFGYRTATNEFNEVFGNVTHILNEDTKIHLSFTAKDLGNQNTPYTYSEFLGFNPPSGPGARPTPILGNQLTGRINNEKNGGNVFLKVETDHSNDFYTQHAFYRIVSNLEEGPGWGQILGGWNVFQDNAHFSSRDSVSIYKFDYKYDLSEDYLIEGNMFSYTSKSSGSRAYAPTLNIPIQNSVNEENSFGGDIYIKRPFEYIDEWGTQFAFGVGFKMTDQEIPFASTLGYTDTGPVTSVISTVDSVYQRDVNSAILEARTKLYNDQFHIVYGGRYDDHSDFGDVTSPKLGLLFFNTPSSAIKLQYGEAFRAPNYDQIAGITGVIGNPDLAPEEVETTELVYQQGFGTSSWGIIGFHTKLKNAINSGLVGGLLTFNNTGTYKSYGIELFYNRQFNPRFSGEFSFSHAHNEIEEDTILTFLNGEEYRGAPSVNLNANFKYKMKTYPIELYWTNLFLNDYLSGATTASSTRLIAPVELGSFYQSDLGMKWNYKDDITLRATIVNMFDKENFLPSYTDSERGVAQIGREFQLGLSMSY